MGISSSEQILRRQHALQCRDQLYVLFRCDNDYPELHPAQDFSPALGVAHLSKHNHNAHIELCGDL